MTQLTDSEKARIQFRINIGFASNDYEMGFLTAMHTYIDHDLEYAKSVGPEVIQIADAARTTTEQEMHEAAYKLGYHAMLALVGGAWHG